MTDVPPAGDDAFNSQPFCTGQSTALFTTFPVVGIGASAGGMAALEAFFSKISHDSAPGMAFVLVLHLVLDHKSMVAELIRLYTSMQVFEVEDGMLVQVNCIYISAPNYDMALLHGVLHLLAPVAPRDQRLPIDYLFTSLAQDQGSNAIGIVLSGNGSDGMLGVRALKDAGGMVMVQSTASCEFDGMPRCAIATGAVDFQLPPADMPRQLMDYLGWTAGTPSHRDAPVSTEFANALNKAFLLLRAQTGHDFSQYKPSTICRRIERRMTVHQIDSMAAYVRYLQQTPDEVQTLFLDLLIGVTSFFRDPSAFEFLETQVLPGLFDGKPVGGMVRVWCTGCSTGQEAYSIAILLVERMEALKQNYTLQVFATDIDSRAIATARAGLYPINSAPSISPERLARFFSLEPGGKGYRIHKAIRDVMVFSEQDLIRDPCFSKLDLISCRNLLIYLDADLQKRLIPLFHYALVPGGRLFLGSSESIGEFGTLFTVLDSKAKVYQRKDGLKEMQGSPRSRAIELVLPPTRARVLQCTADNMPIGKHSMRELMAQALLLQVTPSSVMINASGDILYVHGHTGMYLEPSQGDVGIQNIFKMARPGLRPALSTAVYQAVHSQQISHAHKLKVGIIDHFIYVNISVQQVSSSLTGSVDAALYLVTLKETSAPESALEPTLTVDGAQDSSPETMNRIKALTRESQDKDNYLKRTREALETSIEELKSSNEEMQSVNEELHSTNEEMETSKEELQSVNEELATVNTELQTKVVDLSHANGDMNNLLAGTGVGSLFIDLKLRILRFTPAASVIVNVIPSDVGRPVAHIVHNMVGYKSFVPDLMTVLHNLVAVEREVQTTEGRWFTMHMHPYRTLENVIEGVVVSFVDISEMMETRQALRHSQDLLARTGELAQVGGWELCLSDMELYWSPQTYSIHGLDRSETPTLDQSIEFYAPDYRAVVRAAISSAIDHGTSWEIELPMVTAKGQEIWVRVQGRAEVRDGLTARLYGAIQDITAHRKVHEDLRLANELYRLAVVVRDASDAITVQDLEGLTIAWNPGAQRLYGWSEAQALELNVCQRIPFGLRDGAMEKLARLSRAEILQPYRTQRITQAGVVLDVTIISTALLDVNGQLYAIATTERQISGALL